MTDDVTKDTTIAAIAEQPIDATANAQKTADDDKKKSSNMNQFLLDYEDSEEETLNNRNSSSTNNDTTSHRDAMTAASLFQNNDSNKQQHRWDGFVRKGTRLKTLLEDAMMEVKENIHSNKKKRTRDDVENVENEQQQQAHRSSKSDADHAVVLAREKTAQVMQLERQLKDAQAQVSALTAANASLRDETASNQSRLERTVEALRIAGSNAAKARADADAAEASTAALAQTLQSLQTVITETKRASQILHDEQKQVTATAANVESKLLLKEGELARAHKELKTLRESNAVLEGSHDKWKYERETLEKSVKTLEQQVEQLNREKLERTAVEQARKDRADKVEQEWRRAQTLLVEATSGQAAAEQTQAVLEETIQSLQTANKELYETLKTQQQKSRSENERLSEALTKAEKEAQALRIAEEAANEENQRLKLDKSSADKQIQQLKSRILKLERKTATTEIATNNVSPDPGITTTTNAESNQNTLAFRLPPLAGVKTPAASIASTKAPGSSTREELAGQVCCVCRKESFGIMHTCQCGNSACHKRAHTACVKKIATLSSVSHPGTPASTRLPVVLCNIDNGQTL